MRIFFSGRLPKLDLGLRGGMHHDTPLHRKPAGVYTKIIGNFAEVGYFEDRQIRQLANFERAYVAGPAKGVSGVYGRGGNGFGGGHAKLRAGERKNHGHAKGGT